MRVFVHLLQVAVFVMLVNGEGGFPHSVAELHGLLHSFVCVFSRQFLTFSTWEFSREKMQKEFAVGPFFGGSPSDGSGEKGLNNLLTTGW